ELAYLGQPVGDVDDRRAGGDLVADEPEEPRDGVPAQRRGGLVEDEQGRCDREGLGDLQQVPLPTVRVSTRSRGSTSRPTCASSRPVTSARDPVRKTSAGRATSRFSCTVRSGSTAGCWWTIAMPRAAASRGVSEATVCPATVIVPVSGTSVPDAMLISVDLPAPFSPRIACTSPDSTLTDTSVSAATPPKCFAMPAISSVVGRVAVIV